MATNPIAPNDTQLFANDPQTTDGTSLAFRLDNTKNNFNKVSIWLKGGQGGGTLKMQSLKPGVKIKENIESDWTDISESLFSPNESRVNYLGCWVRLNFTDATAATLQAHLRRDNN